jgi:hypothetical protein
VVLLEMTNLDLIFCTADESSLPSSSARFINVATFPTSHSISPPDRNGATLSKI